MLIDTPLNAVTGKVIDAAIEVHRTLGPGLLESIYLSCLRRELVARQLRFVAEGTIPVVYKGDALAACYRVDLIVEAAVIVEMKSVAALLLVHQAQVLTYTKLTGCPVGLLINFNVSKVVDGVKRLITPGVSVA